mmetsp:Transcript_35768/g.93562  ORF Transcript_35768/g.93562 Transcript_35768/m.93562 type:complete len:1085 (+) Transcript_35768:113-3367(+)
MPEKLPFTVAFCSGADDGHAATNLEIHTPVAKGWATARYCSWPQELVLELKSAARIRKIQVLSHEYKIASKLEIHVATIPNQYRRLGHVSMSSNQTSEYQSRELKSVHVDAIAKYVRLLIHENHLNIHNWYNQVGVVAVNLIGDANPEALETDLIDLNVRRLTGGGIASARHAAASLWVSQGGRTNMAMASGRIDYLGAATRGPPVSGAFGRAGPATAELGLINKLETVDLEHDLKFDMFHDPETAAIVRELLISKRACINRQDYVGAKELKRTIEGLMQAGEELAKLAVIMQRAVASEDYDTAEMVRKQINLFRQRAYTVFGVSPDVIDTARALSPRLRRQSGDRASKGQPPASIPRTQPRGDHRGAGEMKGSGAGPELPWIGGPGAPGRGRGQGDRTPTHSEASVPLAIPRTPPLPQIGSVTRRSSTVVSSRKEPSITLDDGDGHAVPTVLPADRTALTLAERQSQAPTQTLSHHSSRLTTNHAGGSTISHRSHQTVGRHTEHTAVSAQPELQAAQTEVQSEPHTALSDPADPQPTRTSLNRTSSHMSSVAESAHTANTRTVTITAGSEGPPLEAPLQPVIYTVEVLTGNDKKAGTDAKIMLQLFGDHGETKATPLIQSKTHDVPFMPGQTDVFELSPAESVGELSRIKLVSDNHKGSHTRRPQWQVAAVKVSSSSGGMWLFMVNEWLSKKVGLAKEFTVSTTMAREPSMATTAVSAATVHRKATAVSKASTQPPGIPDTATKVPAKQGDGMSGVVMPTVARVDTASVTEEGVAATAIDTTGVAADDGASAEQQETVPTAAGGVAVTHADSIPIEQGGGRAVRDMASPTQPSGPEPLSDARREALAAAIHAYQEHAVACVYSKGFKLKMEGFDAIANALATGTVDTSGVHSVGSIAAATAEIFKFGAADPVLQVTKSAVGSCITFMRCFADAMGPADTRHIVRAVIPALLKKSGDTSLPKRTYAVQAITELFQEPAVAASPAAWKLIVAPVNDKKGFRVAVGRCQAVDALLTSVTVNADNDFTADSVWDFLSPLLGHKKAEIREAATTAAATLFSQVPEDVQAVYLSTLALDSGTWRVLQGK